LLVGNRYRRQETLNLAFLVHPGQDLCGAVLGALSKVPGFVCWEGWTPYAKELDPADSSDYSYGGSCERKIVRMRHGVRTAACNHIEVFAEANEHGVPIFVDEVDYGEADLVGTECRRCLTMDTTPTRSATRER
jgi:hypothetical protein